MEEIMELTDKLVQALTEYPVYKEYVQVIEKINSDPQALARLDNFKRRHLAYVINKEQNFDSFDEERYLSQEYYKLILDKDIKTYFENGLILIELMSTIIDKISSNYALDVFLGDEQ